MTQFMTQNMKQNKKPPTNKRKWLIFSVARTRFELVTSGL
jgi:hypothetical protein